MATNGTPTPITQIGHRAVVGYASEVNERMMHRASKDRAEMKLNGFKISVSAPLPNRPAVLRITTSDGRLTIIGDGGLYSSAELRTLRGEVEPERQRWQDLLTETEQGELGQVDRDLADAQRLAGERQEALLQARAALAAHTFNEGDPRAAARARQLEQAVAKATESWRDAVEIHRSAHLVWREVWARVARAANNRRSDGPQFLAATDQARASLANWRERLKGALS